MDDRDLTLKRVHVAYFLLLVLVGNGLLLWRIARGKSLNWLIQANCATTFILFYLLQFVNDGGFVARYNVQRWVKDHQRRLDLDYLESLGTASWPALQVVIEQAPTTPQAAEADRWFYYVSIHPAEYRSDDWQSWQWRKYIDREQVLPTIPHHAKVTR